MGKTGTTNDFRDALFVGSTYGPDGITVAVRVGFDDNRSLGQKETGGRVALPVFREVMLAVYREGLVGRHRRFRRCWKTNHPVPAGADSPGRSGAGDRGDRRSGGRGLTPRAGRSLIGRLDRAPRCFRVATRVG